MGESRVSWRCDQEPCAMPNQDESERTNLVVGVVGEDTSPDHPLNPGALEITLTPLWPGAPPPPPLQVKLQDPKGGVVFRFEGVRVGWYRIRVLARARPGGFLIVKEATRRVQIVKISRPVKPSDEHRRSSMSPKL